MEPSNAWLQMPEVACVEQLRASGESARNVRLFLTFITAMDRARDANRLWCDGLRLFQSYPESFQPEKISAVPLYRLRERLSQFRVSQRHGFDSKAWSTIANSLASGESPVYKVIESGVGDAKELLHDLRSKSAGQDRFPLLRGSQDRTDVGAHYRQSRRRKNKQYRNHHSGSGRACSPCNGKPWSNGNMWSQDEWGQTENS